MTRSPWIDEEWYEWQAAIDAEDAHWQRMIAHREAGLTWHQAIARDADEITAGLERMNLMPGQDGQDESTEELKARLQRQHDSIERQAAANTQLQDQNEELETENKALRRDLAAWKDRAEKRGLFGRFR